jgi:hypothetical protein
LAENGFKKIISTLLVLIIFSCSNNYKVYIPIVLDGDDLIEAPKMMTDKHRENVILVLNFYNEKWKM